MGEGKHAEWLGIEFLHQLSGDSAQASPVRATFLAHRVGASGRLWMTQGVNIRSVDFASGRIVGLSGYTNLVDGLEGARGWSMDEWCQALQDGAADSEEPLYRLGVALASELLRVENSGGWMVNFVASQSIGEVDDIDSIDSFEAVKAAIAEQVSDDDVRKWLESVASHGVETWVPDDSSVDRWPLDGPVQKLFDSVKRLDSVGALFVEVGRDGWPHLAQLWRLGLVGKKSEPETQEEPAPSADPVPPRVAAPEGKSEPKASPVVESSATTSEAPRRKPKERAPSPETSTNPKKRSVRRRDETDKKTRKKRRRDPRLVAIMRAPYENPDLMEAQLREAYDLLTRFRPEVIFRIKKSDDLDPEKIERRYLDACSRYHPDRYRGADQGVQSLAEGCFTAVSDAFHRLKDEQYVSDLRIRLIEKETGKRVVTDKTRAAAKVEYAKADVLFKQKRFDAAYDLAKQAAEGDPDRWQYEFLRLRLAYRLGRVPVDEVRQAVGAMPGMNSMEKGKSLYIVGEMYMKEGDEKKAFELFRQTLSLDEQNVGARRRLRLKGRREQEANERETTGLFAGLFQRKKK